MKKLNYLLLLRLVCSFALALFLSQLLLCRSVKASSPVPNSDYTYDLYYRNDNGSYVNITANNGITGLTPNRSYDMRIRINLDTLVGQDVPKNFTLRFNHTSGASTDYRVILAQSNGYTITSATYSTLLVNHSSSNTVTTVQVFDIVSPTYDYLYINFVFDMNTVTVDNTGMIALSVVSFTMEDLTLEQQVQAINNTINSNGTVINNSINNGVNSIISNNNSNTDEIVSAVDASNDALMDLIDGHNGGGGGHVFDKMDEQTSLLDTIGDGIATIGSDIDTFFGGFFSNLFDTIGDALTWLFIPDMEDVQEYIEDSIEDFRESTPLLASLLSIFETLISGFNSGTIADSFTIPSFTVPLPQNNSWTFDSVTVPLFPTGLNGLLVPTRNFLAVVTSILIIRFVFFKLFSALGFAGRDNPSDIEDGD